MRTPLIIFLLLLLGSCQTKKADPGTPTEAIKTEHPFEFPDSLSARRLAFVMTLRDSVARNSWDAFNLKRTEGPFIYFNREHSEIFFPDSIMLNRLPNARKHSDDYMVSNRTDTIPYHFELMVSFEASDSAKFYYRHPVQQFLSVEETEIYISSVTSTEMWAPMVIHEMFHHFQLNQGNLFAYVGDTLSRLPADVRDLRKLCENPEFHDGVKKENALLMEALKTDDDTLMVQILRSYLQQREARINQFRKELPDLETIEDYYMIQEGSARYMEYQAIKVMNTLSSQPDLLQVDRDAKFKNYTEFETIDFESDAFYYLVYPNPGQYHYTLGFNLMRVLDKLGVDYKSTLLSNPSKGLHHYVREVLEERGN